MFLYIVLIFCMSLALVSLVLFIKGVGGNTPAFVELPGGPKVNIASSLVGLVLGCGLIYAALQKIDPNDGGPVRPPTTNAAATTNTSTPSNTPPQAPPPLTASISALTGDLSLSPEGAGSQKSWPVEITVAAAGIDAAPKADRWITLLYNETESTQGRWIAQWSAPASQDREWTARVWVPEYLFTNPKRRQHTIRWVALITDRQLLDGADSDAEDVREEFTKYCPKNDDDCADGKSLKTASDSNAIVRIAKSNVLMFKADKQDDNVKLAPHSGDSKPPR